MGLRILFVTQNDPFYVRLFFNEFFRLYSRPEEIVGVVIGQAMGKRSTLSLAKQMYNFYGLKKFIEVGLRYAAYKLLAFWPNGNLAGRFSLSHLCKSKGIPVMHENDINSRRFLEKLKRIRPDLLISVAAPIIFRQGLINIPKYGCINIHNAKLPKYRGMMPNFWQLYHNEHRSGITIHEINQKIDEGRIILQDEVDIRHDESLDSLVRRTKRLGASLMIRAIEMIRSGDITYTENIAAAGSYFGFPSRDDVKEFKKRGKKII